MLIYHLKYNIECIIYILHPSQGSHESDLLILHKAKKSSTSQLSKIPISIPNYSWKQKKGQKNKEKDLLGA